MAQLPSTTSIRGLEIKYFVYRTDFANWNDPEGDYTKDENVLGQSESGELQEIVTNIFANVQWTYTAQTGPIPSDDDPKLNVTYNPITDQYAIRNGEYVL